MRLALHAWEARKGRVRGVLHRRPSFAEIKSIVARESWPSLQAAT